MILQNIIDYFKREERRLRNHALHAQADRLIDLKLECERIRDRYVEGLVLLYKQVPGAVDFTCMKIDPTGALQYYVQRAARPLSPAELAGIRESVIDHERKLWSDTDDRMGNWLGEHHMGHDR